MTCDLSQRPGFGPGDTVQPRRLQRVFGALILTLFYFLSASALAQEANVTPLFQTDLEDIPDREGVMLTVEYPPGVSSARHRHNAHTFVYVLEGSVVMQVDGGEPMVLGPGQTFYETPEDIHAVSKNASMTEPAKVLVFLVKPTGAPGTIPVP